MRYFLLLLALSTASPALAEDITVTVLEAHDGDTIKVRLTGDCLPGLFRVMLVRARGCDTPELKDERTEVAALAREARAFTSGRLQVGSQVILRGIAWEKYGGRILANVDGLCEALIDAGLARPYRGSGSRPW